MRRLRSGESHWASTVLHRRARSEHASVSFACLPLTRGALLGDSQRREFDEAGLVEVSGIEDIAQVAQSLPCEIVRSEVGGVDHRLHLGT